MLPVIINVSSSNTGSSSHALTNPAGGGNKTFRSTYFLKNETRFPLLTPSLLFADETITAYALTLIFILVLLVYLILWFCVRPAAEEAAARALERQGLGRPPQTPKAIEPNVLKTFPVVVYDSGNRPKKPKVTDMEINHAKPNLDGKLENGKQKRVQKTQISSMNQVRDETSEPVQHQHSNQIDLNTIDSAENFNSIHSPQGLVGDTHNVDESEASWMAWFIGIVTRTRVSFNYLSRSRRDQLAAARNKFSTHKCLSAQDNCAICLEVYEAGDSLRILPCRHKFHQHCIDSWLLRETAACVCPICKFDLQPSPQKE